jgi:2-polyprenyl-3-methyl-5-hydroxy-6-metoxy-1,4-benzoquinol methylase
MSGKPVSPSGAAFDHVAPAYDAEATYLEISRWIRALVWERLAELFSAGDHVLEIGCGTGEDAIWLARRGVSVTASDASAAMLDEARRKAEQAGVSDLIAFRQLDLATVETWNLPAATFDGAISNYGPLNCIGDWTALGRTLAGAVRPGGRLGLAVMGPFCAWETVWHALHGDLRTATRRWRGRTTASIGGVSFPVYYPTPARLARELGPAFQRRRLSGLGVWLPPSDLYAALGKRSRLARGLLRLEKRTAARWPFPYLGDHYWLEMQRVR